MKPRPFDYVRPDTVEEALALLAEYGDDARVLAGGQSLVPMLNLRLVDTKTTRAQLRVRRGAVWAGDHPIETEAAAWEAEVVSDQLGVGAAAGRTTTAGGAATAGFAAGRAFAAVAFACFSVSAAVSACASEWKCLRASSA